MKKFIGKNKKDYSKLILEVQTRSATELVKHKSGPGLRFVFSDHKNNPGGQIYSIVRVVKNVRSPKPHVESHAHPVDSLWMFEGNTPKLTGLKAEVNLDDHIFIVNSPASVYIPAGVAHSYRFISGSGKFINIVLTGGAAYNKITK